MHPLSTKECFIIGSGSSLLDLTSEQIAYLKEHPHTLAMNKYYLFYEKVEIVPKALFLADHRFPTHRVFTEIIAKAKKSSQPPTIYVDNYYEILFRRPYRHLRWNLKERLKLYKNNRYLAPFWINYPQLNFFSHRQGIYEGFSWSNNISEPLYWMHGSLTTAINLANIIYPGCDIKLIGVDLKSPEPFYEQELQTRQNLMDAGYFRNKRVGQHHTAIASKNGVTMLDAIKDLIRPELAKNNVNLFCCNPSSLLVTEDICEYAAIIPSTSSLSTLIN